MFKRINKSRHKCRQAFTLVELIVVLVILAIVAAITIPALTGYIKKAKRDKNDEAAHYALVACQSVMTELYANPGGYTPTYLDKDNNKNNVNWVTGTNQSWGNKVLDLMDIERGENEPYILIFGVGNSDERVGLSLNQQYTVYYIAYVATENSPAVFYVNGEWYYTYPKGNGGPINEKKYGPQGNQYNFRNTIFVKNEKGRVVDYIPLQFYIVCNNTGMDPTNWQFWTDTSDPRSLKSHSEGYFNG